MGVTVMSEAIAAYRHVAASDKFIQIEKMRSKARHDEAQALSNARSQERKLWQEVVADKDAALADKDAAIANKDAAIADKDATIADKDATIADKDAQIAELLTQLKN